MHVLEAEPARRVRWPMLVGLGLVLALAGAAGYVVWADPFADRQVAAPPPPAADNLLGAAWSFETAADSSPSAAWSVPDEAPAGLAFGGSFKVSGSGGAWADAGENGWARIVTADSYRVAGARAVSLSAVSNSPDVSLLLRFEAQGRPTLDVTVASGEGHIAGSLPVPPGYGQVRAGITVLGAGAVDDVVLTTLSDAEGPTALRRGLFDLVPLPQGFGLFRGDELLLHFGGVALRDAAGAVLPPSVAAFPGEGAVALPDGRRLPLSRTLDEDGNRVVVRARVEGLPADAQALSFASVHGSLADAPLGIGSERGFETFTDDFRVERVNALVLGRTQDRILFSGTPFTLAGSWRPDGSIALVFERDLGAGDFGELGMQTSFQAERVQAAQLRDQAVDLEAAGELGAALALLETILTEYPYDEDVLAQAAAARGRLQARMQEKLDAIDADLEDALFLASAQRCREVLADGLAAADAWAGSSAEARFREQAAALEQRAHELLEEDRARRAERLSAIAESFREAGGFPAVTAELDDYLSRFLAPHDTSTEGSADP